MREPTRFWKKALRVIDPRTARIRNPGPVIKHKAWLAVGIAAFLGVGAVAVASTGADPPDPPAASTEHVSPSKDPASSYSGLEPGAVSPAPVTREKTEERHAERAETVEPSVAKPADFHDPLYVFTDTPALKVNAYPLKDPAGVVVNLDGCPEPELSADELVGKDPRIRSVRRRTTSTGIRYIIGLRMPVKKIEVVTEGNVVMIAPLD